MKATKRLQMTFSNTVIEVMNELAEKRGLSQSAYLSYLVMADRERVEAFDLLRQIPKAKMVELMGSQTSLLD